ncbi:hypothetical protein SAMN05421821_102321 [Mucilaginibacter lappiensis]|uniref:Uncharacterized protein n=1 Tax=Mucilaginibacter lappiensis TaxID=354630 RepID=A0ABR6PFD2_9SPHI|nr:hypothetical protein [Mucilaginibacter lappiensis]MBB6108442.1 hypothetical protein [Mucilaginibacter lappiensis]SIQ37815.1 hypothetical protein SAMN05421821_102321 [Mucilaginibacter lappiensis]
MNINKKAILLFCVIALSFAACKHHTKFDRENWDYGDGLEFPNRDNMLDDLLKSYKLKGLKYQEVIHLLHRPQLSNTTEMVYDIDEISKKGKTIYVKKLILSLKDSVVTDVKVYEHSDKKK